MTSQKVINAPVEGRPNQWLVPQVIDLRDKSLICEESGNDAFRFPWSKKPRMDFLRPYQRLTPGILETLWAAC